MLKWLTIILCLFGLGIGIYTVATETEARPDLPLAREPSVNPYEKGVAALGFIEPSGRDVAIVAPETGLVTTVMVDVGQSVKRGDQLFQLDARLLEADLIRARAAVKVAEVDIDRWHALPRAEDLPPLEAAVARAESMLSDREEILRLTREAASKGSGNDREISAARFAADIARAELERAKADLAKMKSGGWKPDLAVAQINKEARQKEVEAITLLVERLTVRAPRDATVLRRSIEPGEFAGTDSTRPALILGDLSALRVRAQVDEEDIALIGASPKAIARTRGGLVAEIPLTFIRIEPYARPKTNLTGSNSERVDTRVIDVVFEMSSPPHTAIYPGQAVDVFIEAK